MLTMHSPARPARSAPWIIAVCATLAVLASPCPAAADGYNDWGGEIAGPGEFYFVPAVLAAAKPDWYLYWQWQNQIGLTDKVDLLITLATTQETETWTADLAYIQPRYALSETLCVSVGVFVPGHVDADPISLMPGIFHTWWIVKDAWKLNWNVVWNVPLRAPGDHSYFIPLVLERPMSEELAVFAEVDVWGTFAEPAVDVFVGAQIELGDMDSLNLSAMLPAYPELVVEGLAGGIWWSHGFEVPMLGRAAQDGLAGRAKTNTAAANSMTTAASAFR